MNRMLLVLALASLVACETAPAGPLSIPITTKLTGSGLSAPVDVVRDQYGVPHIYGSTLPDVSYAEGYLMAQDRMIEMDLSRRTGAGTLAELVGALSSTVLLGDIQMRQLHMQATSQQAFMALQASSDPTDQEIVASLTSFAAGVNAWVADLKAGKYSIPDAYSTFYDPTTSAPWSEVDSLVLGRLLTFQLSFDGASDPFRTMLDAAATTAFSGDPTRAKIATDLEILSPIDPTYTLPGGFPGLIAANSTAKRTPKRKKDNRALVEALKAQMTAMRDLGRERITHPDKGSNNFVIGPSKSTTGNGLVANDTHLQLSNPPVFWLVHLVVSNPSNPLNVMGVQFPGIPGVILGMNQHIAWGATVNNLDVTDTYANSIVTCTAGGSVPCMQTASGQVPLIARPETFTVGFEGKVSQTVTLTYYDTPTRGPITPRVVTGTAGAPPTFAPLNIGGTEYSVQWTGLEPTQEIRALIHLDRASSVDEAKAALDADFKTGGQNWVIGDDQGHIGWTQTCRVPRRPAGTIPWKVLAGDGTADWGADLDAHYIPHGEDPTTGFFATANADPIGVTASGDPLMGAPIIDGIPLYIGSDFDPGTRVGRITKRLNAQAKLTMDDVQSVQADVVTEYGPLYAPTFVAVAQALTEEIATPGSHPDLTALLMAAPATTKAIIGPAHDAVMAWSYNTPSAISAAGAAAPSTADLTDSTATALIAAFTGTLANRALNDELGKMNLTVDDVGSVSIRKLLARMCNQPTLLATSLQANGDSILWDDVTTTDVETKEVTAAAALLDAIAALTNSALGTDITTWRWGTIHTLTLDSLLPLSALNLPPPTDPSFPKGYPRHGDDGTVDVGNHGLSTTDFTYADGPAIRFVCELTPKGPVARNVLPGGETFDPTAPHYSDQMNLWRVNQTFDLAYQPADVTASAKIEYTTNKDGRVHFAPPGK